MSSRPTHIEFCTLCTLSNQRPRVVFRDGVCGACNFSDAKAQTDWSKREDELLRLLEKHRDGEGEYDVVVPCSGGKDGGFTAHQLQQKYGMRVLAVTWAPLRYTEIGRKNLDSFIGSGFDHILGTPNPEVTRRLAREAFVEMGDPFQPFIYGQTNFPVSIAKKYGATLIMYGENGEVEYGGDEAIAESPIKAFSRADKDYFSGLSLEHWKSAGFSNRDLSLFQRPKDVSGLEQHFFGYYKRWDPQENYYYASEHLGFSPNDVRSEGTYSKYASLDDKFDGFHYYLGFVKFGIGRATSDSAHEIRDGKITRAEGIELVRQFDGEFPARYFDEFLEYIQMSEQSFLAVVDRWRSEIVWSQNSSGSWTLNAAVWK